MVRDFRSEERAGQPAIGTTASGSQLRWHSSPSLMITMSAPRTRQRSVRLSVWPMTGAALAVGIVVAFFAFYLTRVTQLKEDASFTLIYLMSLAGGVVMISKSGSGVDLLHILFGNILAINNDALFLAAGTACATVLRSVDELVPVEAVMTPALVDTPLL